MYINSNISADEFFQNHCTDDNAKQFYDAVRDKFHSNEKENNSLERQNEMLREQLSFARDLISNIEDSLKENTRLNEFKKDFIRLTEDSFFER